MTQRKGSSAPTPDEAKPKATGAKSSRSKASGSKTSGLPGRSGTAQEARKSAGSHTLEPIPACDFPIVGIGASAGGLEALELFLGQVPPDSGLALVVVQHLDPNHKDLLVELLQRKSPLPVVQITDRLRVQPNHVYVIPPNRDLSILHGVLHLLEPAAPRGLRLPIDHFFRSLAEDQLQRSLVVILSGMGADGTKGASAVKEKGGAVFAQSQPKFEGMPRSVAEAGLVDVTADAEVLAQRILDYVNHLPLLEVRAEPGRDDRDSSGLEKVILVLRARTGHDFSLYKKSTLYRRIERRMGLHQLSRITDYVRYLRENAQESDLLFRELLIGVTNFFRDPEVWEQLKNEALPALLAERPEGAVLRAWCPGCSTGEEAYSLAMTFREALESMNPEANFTLQIFATDLDKDAIDKARVGSYAASCVEDLSEARLQRFFVEDERGFRVIKDIREMVIFAPQNLVMDPPFTKLDLLLCRNLLIYLEGGLQKRLMPLFHYSLNSGGFLVLGNSESVGQATDLFSPLPGKSRIFRKVDVGLRGDQVTFPSSFPGTVSRFMRSPHVDTQPLAPPSSPTSRARRMPWCCSTMPPQQCWSRTPATSSTSAARRGNTWSRPRARPT